MKKFLLFVFIATMTSCTGATVPDGDSYFRVSEASYGGRLLQWLGLAADGSYCQMSTNKDDYEWTIEDLELLSDRCPADSEIGRMLQVFRAANTSDVVETGNDGLN